MKISTKGRYALRMMIDLAEHQGEGFVSLKDIAARQGISKKYLEQIIPILNRSNFLQAECLYGKRYPGTDGGQPCTCCVSGYNARGLRAQRVLRDTATMERPS